MPPSERITEVVILDSGCHIGVDVMGVYVDINVMPMYVDVNVIGVYVDVDVMGVYVARAVKRRSQAYLNAILFMCTLCTRSLKFQEPSFKDNNYHVYETEVSRTKLFRIR